MGSHGRRTAHLPPRPDALGPAHREPFEPRDGFDPRYLNEPRLARLWHSPLVARWKIERGARVLTDKAAVSELPFKTDEWLLSEVLADAARRSCSSRPTCGRPSPPGRGSRDGARPQRPPKAPGSTSLNVAPRPGDDSTTTSPPCSCAIVRTTARPSPLRGGLREPHSRLEHADEVGGGDSLPVVAHGDDDVRPLGRPSP